MQQGENELSILDRRKRRAFRRLVGAGIDALFEDMYAAASDRKLEGFSRLIDTLPLVETVARLYEGKQMLANDDGTEGKGDGKVASSLSATATPRGGIAVSGHSPSVIASSLPHSHASPPPPTTFEASLLFLLFARRHNTSTVSGYYNDSSSLGESEGGGGRRGQHHLSRLLDIIVEYVTNRTDINIDANESEIDEDEDSSSSVNDKKNGDTHALNVQNYDVLLSITNNVSAKKHTDDEPCWSLAQVATKMKFTGGVRILISKAEWVGAHWGKGSLFFAAASPSPSSFSLPSPLHVMLASMDDIGQTVFHVAAASGNVPITTMLLDCAAALSSSVSAIHPPTSSSSAAVLFQIDAVLSIRDVQGRSAADVAAGVSKAVLRQMLTPKAPHERDDLKQKEQVPFQSDTAIINSSQTPANDHHPKPATTVVATPNIPAIIVMGNGVGGAQHQESTRNEKSSLPTTAAAPPPLLTSPGDYIVNIGTPRIEEDTEKETGKRVAGHHQHSGAEEGRAEQDAARSPVHVHPSPAAAATTTTSPESSHSHIVGVIGGRSSPAASTATATVISTSPRPSASPPPTAGGASPPLPSDESAAEAATYQQILALQSKMMTLVQKLGSSIDRSNSVGGGGGDGRTNSPLMSNNHCAPDGSSTTPNHREIAISPEMESSNVKTDVATIAARSVAENENKHGAAIDTDAHGANAFNGGVGSQKHISLLFQQLLVTEAEQRAAIHRDFLEDRLVFTRHLHRLVLFTTVADMRPLSSSSSSSAATSDLNGGKVMKRQPVETAQQKAKVADAFTEPDDELSRSVLFVHGEKHVAGVELHLLIQWRGEQNKGLEEWCPVGEVQHYAVVQAYLDHQQDILEAEMEGFYDDGGGGSGAMIDNSTALLEGEGESSPRHHGNYPPHRHDDAFGGGVALDGYAAPASPAPPSSSGSGVAGVGRLNYNNNHHHYISPLGQTERDQLAQQLAALRAAAGSRSSRGGGGGLGSPAASRTFSRSSNSNTTANANYTGTENTIDWPLSPQNNNKQFSTPHHDNYYQPQQQPQTQQRGLGFSHQRTPAVSGGAGSSLFPTPSSPPGSSREQGANGHSNDDRGAGSRGGGGGGGGRLLFSGEGQRRMRRLVWSQPVLPTSPASGRNNLTHYNQQQLGRPPLYTHQPSRENNDAPVGANGNADPLPPSANTPFFTTGRIGVIIVGGEEGAKSDVYQNTHDTAGVLPTSNPHYHSTTQKGAGNDFETGQPSNLHRETQQPVKSTTTETMVTASTGPATDVQMTATAAKRDHSTHSDMDDDDNAEVGDGSRRIRERSDSGTALELLLIRGEFRTADTLPVTDEPDGKRDKAKRGGGGATTKQYSKENAHQGEGNAVVADDDDDVLPIPPKRGMTPGQLLRWMERKRMKEDGGIGSHQSPDGNDDAHHQSSRSAADHHHEREIDYDDDYGYDYVDEDDVEDSLQPTPDRRKSSANLLPPQQQQQQQPSLDESTTLPFSNKGPTAGEGGGALRSALRKPTPVNLEQQLLIDFAQTTATASTPQKSPQGEEAAASSFRNIPSIVSSRSPSPPTIARGGGLNNSNKDGERDGGGGDAITVPLAQPPPPPSRSRVGFIDPPVSSVVTLPPATTATTTLVKPAAAATWSESALSKEGDRQSSSKTTISEKEEVKAATSTTANTTTPSNISSSNSIANKPQTPASALLSEYEDRMKRLGERHALIQKAREDMERKIAEKKKTVAVATTARNPSPPPPPPAAPSSALTSLSATTSRSQTPTVYNPFAATAAAPSTANVVEDAARAIAQWEAAAPPTATMEMTPSSITTTTEAGEGSVFSAEVLLAHHPHHHNNIVSTTTTASSSSTTSLSPNVAVRDTLVGTTAAATTTPTTTTTVAEKTPPRRSSNNDTDGRRGSSSRQRIPSASKKGPTVASSTPSGKYGSAASGEGGGGVSLPPISSSSFSPTSTRSTVADGQRISDNSPHQQQRERRIAGLLQGSPIPPIKYDHQFTHFSRSNAAVKGNQGDNSGNGVLGTTASPLPPPAVFVSQPRSETNNTSPSTVAIKTDDTRLLPAIKSVGINRNNSSNAAARPLSQPTRMAPLD